MSRRSRRIPLLALTVASLGLVTLSALAFDVQQQGTLISPNDWGDNFGLQSVVIDGDTLVVAAEKTNRIGRVYVYAFDGTGWGLESSFNSPHIVDASSFGKALALDGDTLAVSQHGELHVFERTGAAWNHVQTLSPSDGGFSGYDGIPQFATKLSLAGDILVVGASSGGGCPTGACYADRAYVYEKQGGIWVETAILRASDDPGDSAQRFGWDVSTDGVGIAVSAPLAADAVYVFERDGVGGWIETAKVRAANYWDFGTDLELSGDTLVVGDFQSAEGGITTGAVTVFERVGGSWNEQQRIVEPELGQGGYFGERIDFEGDLLIVGATHRIYVYERELGAWSRIDRLDCGAATSYGFGHTVALSGTTFAGGGCYDGSPNTFQVNVYEAGVPDFDLDGISDDTDNCFDVPNADQSDVDGDGIGDACDLCDGDDLTGDTDEDLVCDDIDNCPTDSNEHQIDDDGDGLGNVCELDSDADGKIDDIDNCPAAPNPDQADSDSDGFGDVCDEDDDGDGVADVVDNCPILFNPDQLDSDGDGRGDLCDSDDDGDGVSDELDLCPGTPIDVLWDEDGCSGVQLIYATCGEPQDHPNHGQYVRCVAQAGNDGVAAGLLSAKERAAIVRAAAKEG